jgi:flagellar basal body-associated protein FliL
MSEHKRGAASIILLILIAVTLAVVIYLLLQPDTAQDPSLRISLLSVIAITVVVLVWYILWEFNGPNRLRRLLKKIEPMVDIEATEEVKSLYLRIYDLYMKLSEKKKQNFYAKVNSLRERLEEHLQNEKEIERLLKTTEKGSIDDQKKKYFKIYAIYEKLPRKVQNQYYPQVVQLRDRLERGN